MLGAAKANERDKLERICRYIARPALAEGRLSLSKNAEVIYKLKTPWDDGTTAIKMTPMELIERLVALVPRPRVHLTRFHGVLAPHYKFRRMIVPQKTPPGNTLVEKPLESLLGLAFLAAGVPAYFWWRRRDRVRKQLSTVVTEGGAGERRGLTERSAGLRQSADSPGVLRGDLGTCRLSILHGPELEHSPGEHSGAILR